MNRNRLPIQIAILLGLLATFRPAHEAIGQSLPVHSLADQQLSIRALLYEDPYLPVTQRPYSWDAYRRTMEPGDREVSGWWDRSLYQYSMDLPLGFRAGPHSLSVQNTYNSRIPYSENNAAAWYGRGHSLEWSGGVWLTSRFLTLSLQPQIVWQQNLDFLTPRFVPTNSDGEPRYIAEGIGTSLDAPFRFGPNPFWTTDWGYSSIRLHAGPVEAGYSSEPQQWGPATRYPLTMSAHAPGVHHAFVGTRRPVRIPWVGRIQFKWMVGYAQESGYFDGSTAGEKRMLNALHASWSPPFLEGLTLGVIRAYHINESDGFQWSNVLSMFDAIQKVSLSDTNPDSDGVGGNRNQVASVYARLHMPEARAEIWGELFREDHSYDLRDIANEPHHNSAWAIGFRKASDGPWADFYVTHLEITNLAITMTEMVRHQAYYYTHSAVRHGHTNRGQVLGAAIGPGSTSQYLGLEGYRGNWRVGTFLQRVAENDSYHVQRNPIGSNLNNEPYGDYYRHRVNLNVGANMLYGPGPYYLTASLVWSKLYNYGRFDYGDYTLPFADHERRDLTNVQFQMGVTYAF
ncbi:MAG: capsule assembly Wzi family protein [Balneolaceae bacterium]